MPQLTLHKHPYGLEHLDRITEWFTHHKATLVGEPGLQRITWKQPGTSTYQVIFTLSQNMLFVSGDLGSAAYTLTCPATREELIDFDFGYLHKKMRACEDGKTRYDAKTAIRQMPDDLPDNTPVDLLALFKRVLEDATDVNSCYHQLEEALREFDADYAHAFLDINGIQNANWYDGVVEMMPELFDNGVKPSIESEAYWVALQYALVELKRQDEKPVTPA